MKMCVGFAYNMKQLNTTRALVKSLHIWRWVIECWQLVLSQSEYPSECLILDAQNALLQMGRQEGMLVVSSDE